MNTAGAPHLDDGDHARLADGECTGEEARRLQEHVHSCTECRARADEFTGLASAFKAAITKAGPVRPNASRRDPRQSELVWWRRRGALAAVLALIIVAGVVASPARAWLAAMWSVLSPDGSGATEEGRGEESTTEAATERAVITFRPQVTEFAVDVSSHQAVGALTIGVHEEATARAAVIGGLGSEGFLVLPEGLRISTLPESTADYIVHLPTSVTTVVVRIGGEFVERFEPGSADSERRFGLAAR